MGSWSWDRVSDVRFLFQGLGPRPGNLVRKPVGTATTPTARSLFPGGVAGNSPAPWVSCPCGQGFQGTGSPPAIHVGDRAHGHAPWNTKRTRLTK